MDKGFAIFDMDGTLVDSLGYWSDLAAEYLESKGISPVPPKILEAIRPMTLSQSAALFARKFALPGDPGAAGGAFGKGCADVRGLRHGPAPDGGLPDPAGCHKVF